LDFFGLWTRDRENYIGSELAVSILLVRTPSFAQVVGRRCQSNVPNAPQLKGRQAPLRQQTQSFYVGNVDSQTAKDVEQYVKATYTAMLGDTMSYIKVFPLAHRPEGEGPTDLGSILANSFRLVVNTEQSVTIMNGAFWPLGVRVRHWEYRQRPVRPQHLQTPEPTDTVAHELDDDGFRTVKNKRRHGGQGSPNTSSEVSRQHGANMDDGANNF
jgi:hypothetical protein